MTKKVAEILESWREESIRENLDPLAAEERKRERNRRKSLKNSKRKEIVTRITSEALGWARGMAVGLQSLITYTRGAL